MATTSGGYHHGDLKHALLDAARTMLREGESLSLRELARRVEVSPRAPYRHFASKDALLSILAATGFDALSGSLVAAAREASPGRELSAQAKAYVSFALGDPPLFRLMFSDRVQQADADLSAAKQTTKALLTRRIAADASPGDDVQARALGCWSLVHGLAILMLDGLAQDDLPVAEDELVDRVTQVMF